MPTAGLCLAQVVEERCEYRVNPENSNWTEVKREAWVSSSLFGVSRAIQVSSSSKAAARPCSTLALRWFLHFPFVHTPILMSFWGTQNHHCESHCDWQSTRGCV